MSREENIFQRQDIEDQKCIVNYKSQEDVKIKLEIDTSGNLKTEVMSFKEREKKLEQYSYAINAITIFRKGLTTAFEALGAKGAGIKVLKSSTAVVSISAEFISQYSNQQARFHDSSGLEKTLYASGKTALKLLIAGSTSHITGIGYKFW